MWCIHICSNSMYSYKKDGESLLKFKHLGELNSADHWRNQEMHLMHLFLFRILIWTIFQFHLWCRFPIYDVLARFFLCNECQLILWNIMEHTHVACSKSCMLYIYIYPTFHIRLIDRCWYYYVWNIVWIESDKDELLVVNTNMYG